MQWTAGAYYSEDESFFSFALIDQTAEIANRPNVIGPGGATFPLLIGTPIASNDIIIPGGEFADVGVREVEYFGIFGQAEWSISDQLRITGGLRFNDESRTLVGAGSNFTGDTNGDGTVDPVVAFTQQVLNNPTPAVVPTNPNTVFNLFPNSSDAITGDVSFDNVSWRLGAEYDLNDEILLYANAATGFLSGAISNGGAATDEQESQVIEVNVTHQCDV